MRSLATVRWRVWAAAPALVMTVTLGSGCATRPSPAVGPDPAARRAQLQRADLLARSGCYTDLVEAVATYESILHERDEPDIRHRAFEAASVGAIRERLIGLYPGRLQDAPARLASGLPSQQTATALDVLAIIDWRRGSRPPVLSGQRFADIRARAVAAHAALQPLAATQPVAATLLVHLLSAHPFASLPPDAPLAGSRVSPLSADTAPWAAAHGADASVTFAWRLAQRATDSDAWYEWLEAHPDCHEALVPIADVALARGHLLTADDTLARALDAFPDLIPAAVTRGEIRTELGDDAGALAFFTDVVARVPAHREARLGQLIALSNLMRHDEAIAAADALLALGEWYLGEAYYWKAWNLFQQRRLVDARAALVEAKRLLFSADVLYLGALIAYREEQWDEARTELSRTIETGPSHCDAHFTLGAVHLLTQAWPQAGPSFTQAEACFAAREPALEAAVRAVDEANLTDAQKAGLRTRRQQALDATITQKHWARYNLAIALSNTGARAAARAIAESVVQQGGAPATAATDLLLQLDARPSATPPQ